MIMDIHVLIRKVGDSSSKAEFEDIFTWDLVYFVVSSMKR